MPDQTTDQSRPAGRLALADGSIFKGRAFGAVGQKMAIQAEIVFNTAMCGYQESLTDPSYSGQILVETFPLIGNYGINEEDVESQKVQVAGFVIRELARVHSNFRATTDLSSYLAQNGVLGLERIDTRALTRKLRTAGVMPGILTDRQDLTNAQLVEMAASAPSMAGQNLVPGVGCTSDQSWSQAMGEWPGPQVPETGKSLHVLALDCGAKRNILRHLVQRGCKVTVVPHTISADEIRARHAAGEVDGLFVSNGPGDPAAVEQTVATLSELFGPASTGPWIPTFGICLGHQLLSLAVGARTFKLKFGHRGANQPVLNTLSQQVEITSQNHGFAVDPESLKKVGGEPTT